MNPRHLQLRGAAIGLAATLLVVVLQAAGGLERLENLTLDLRQVWCNSLDVHPSIVHVDIDDGALARVGRWPDLWPRDLIADLLRVVAAAGARTIAVDLIFKEPAAPRQAAVGAPRDPGGIEGDVAAAAGGSRLVVPDLELAAALREAGTVILSVQAEFSARAAGAPPAGSTAAQARGIDAARAALRRIVAQDFAAPDDEIARRWSAAAAALPPESARIPLDRMLAGVKREAADALVADALKRQPGIQRLDGLCAALELDAAAVAARDRADLVAALADGLARQALLARIPPLPESLRGSSGVATIRHADAPYYPLARAAHGFGVVSVQKDADGVVRRLTPLFDYDGRLAPHLGLAVAADVLGFDLAGAARESGGLCFTLASGRTLHVPLDSRGDVILHWSPDDRRWQQSPRHITAARLMQVVEDLAAARENVRQQCERLVLAVGTANPPMVVNGRTVYAKSVAVALERIDSWRGQAVARLTAKSIVESAIEDDDLGQAAAAARTPTLSPEERGGSTPPPATGDGIELPDDLVVVRRDAERKIREELASYREQPPRDAEEQARADACRRILDPDRGVDFFAEIDALAAANRRMLNEAAAILRDLRERMAGNIVFVGHTATAQGDVIPTAVDPSLPGVIAHAALVNAFLSGARFLHTPDRWLEIGLTLFFGALTTVITSGRGIRVTLAFVVTLVVGFAAVNAWILFRQFEWYVQLVPPLLAVVGAAVPVTFYRWWTTDRQRREIRVQFAQYTSPALANRIADDPAAMQLLTRVESREITCFFSDLKGFTTLAEQTAPDHVQRVLNIYLDRMSEVLDRRRALINKFMGDGIFAFFNSTVLPQPDHPRAACEATLECQEALRLLRENPPGGRDDLMARLEMRVGMASGLAGVGDFGSSRKKDYTVIGDVANIAARLEPANKVFGTSAMVSGPTRDAVIEHYDFRYLADLQVKGKNQTVPVFELMGRKGEVSDEDLAWAERFAVGVELYRLRKWDECITHFTRMLARRFDDAGASAYITACEEKKAFPPEDDWSGAFELKEK